MTRPAEEVRAEVERLRASAVIATVLPLMLLAGCTPEKAEWQEVCVESHTQFTGVLPMLVGKITIMQPQYVVVCDRKEWRCMAGQDGSNDCGARP